MVEQGQLKQKEEKMKSMHRNMPIDEYHANKAIGSSVVKAALKSARKYKRSIDGEFKQTSGMALGDAVHAKVLEPSRFAEMYQRESGKTGDSLIPILDVLKITPAECRKFDAMVHALNESDEFQDLLSDAKCIEASFFAELEGMNFKCRPDLITNDGWLVDLKTSGGMSDHPVAPEEFSRTFFDLGYDVQMVLYTKVFEEATGKKVKGFIFPCVDAKEDDPGVKIYRFPRGESQWWKIGAHRLRSGVEKIRLFKDMEEFPVFDTVVEDDLPLSYNANSYAVEQELV